jgi:hypothetical protein
MPFAKGQRVRHPAKPEWGQVLEDSASTSVRVFFVGAGEKELSLSHATPLIVNGAEAAHPVLDNLKPIRTDAKVRYESLPRLVDRFLERFPQGFYGSKYLRGRAELRYVRSKLTTVLN